MIKLTLQSQDFLVRMHNSRIRRDWSPQDVVGIRQVHNDNLILLIDLLPDTDEMVALERK